MACGITNKIIITNTMRKHKQRGKRLEREKGCFFFPNEIWADSKEKMTKRKMKLAPLTPFRMHRIRCVSCRVFSLESYNSSNFLALYLLHRNFFALCTKKQKKKKKLSNFYNLCPLISSLIKLVQQVKPSRILQQFLCFFLQNKKSKK